MFKRILAAAVLATLSLPPALAAGQPEAGSADEEEDAAPVDDFDTEDDDDEADDDDDDDEADDDDDGVGIVAIRSGDDGGVVISGNAERDEDEEAQPLWQLAIGGYIRTQFTTIANDPEVDFVGQHDGFRMANARLTLDGAMANGLGFRFQFDGAVDRDLTDIDDPVADLGVQMRDVFIFYQPFDFLRVTAGQFKPPFDREELTSTSDILFINRSVGSRGVRNVEGFNVGGISVTRQPGIRVDSEPFYFLADEENPESGPGVSYGVAMTNGQSADSLGANGANLSLNDNDKFAYYGRAAFHWGEMVEAGGAYYFNDATTGSRPDLVGVRKSGWTADLTFDAFGLFVMGSVMHATEQPEGDIPQAQRTQLAYQAQIGYEEPFIGLQPTYRFAYYDPTSEFESEAESPIFQNDALTYHTVGLNYNAQNYPFRLMLNYTITGEQEARELNNNRFDALLQLEW